MHHCIASIPAADGETEIDVRVEIDLDFSRDGYVEHRIDSIRLTGSTVDVSGELSLAQLAAVERAVEAQLDRLIEEAHRDAADELAAERAADLRF